MSGGLEFASAFWQKPLEAADCIAGPTLWEVVLVEVVQILSKLVIQDVK